MSDAAQLIRSLQAGGLTQREIARRINRGPSYVSKVATGRKPGGGLDPALRALQRGSGSFHAPRRRGATGRLASVRQPASSLFGGSGGGDVRSSPLRAWRGADGWHDLSAGGRPWKSPSEANYVLIDVPGIGLRQYAVDFDFSFGIDELIKEFYASYGVAE